MATMQQIMDIATIGVRIPRAKRQNEGHLFTELEAWKLEQLSNLGFRISGRLSNRVKHGYVRRFFFDCVLPKRVF